MVDAGARRGSATGDSERLVVVISSRLARRFPSALESASGPVMLTTHDDGVGEGARFRWHAVLSPRAADVADRLQGGVRAALEDRATPQVPEHATVPTAHLHELEARRPHVGRAVDPGDRDLLDLVPE